MERWITRTSSFTLVQGNHSHITIKSLYDAVKALKAAHKDAYLLMPDGSRWCVLGNGVVQFGKTKAAGA